MNYICIYDKIISRALERKVVDGEIHHIKPRCIGGSDNATNLVKLTYKEHYTAHHLLYRIYKTPKLAFAWRSMYTRTNGNRVNAKGFAAARKAWAVEMAKINTGRAVNSATRLKMSAAKIGLEPWNKGVSMADLGISTISNIELQYNGNPKICAYCGGVISYRKRKNIYCGMECRNKDAKSWITGNNNKPNSTSFKKGNVVSDEVRRKISSAMKGIRRASTECPHCNKIGDISLMKRWHFDNCKNKDSL